MKCIYYKERKKKVKFKILALRKNSAVVLKKNLLFIIKVLKNTHASKLFPYLREGLNSSSDVSKCDLMALAECCLVL